MELYNFISVNGLDDIIDSKFLRLVRPVARIEFEENDILYRAEIIDDIVYAYIFDNLVAKHTIAYDTWYTDYIAIIPSIYSDINPELGIGKTKYEAQRDLLGNYADYNIEALWDR